VSTLRQKTLHFIGVWAFVGQALAASYVLPEKSSSMGPQGLALGGALAGTKNRSDFMISNPASPGLEKKYTLGVRYTSAGDTMGVQIVDTSSSSLGGAVSYWRREFKDVNASQDVTLGSFDRLEAQSAISLMSQIAEGVSLGITGRHSYNRPMGAALSSQGSWSGDIGILLELSKEWRLGLLGQDLLPDKQAYLYKSFSLGLSGNLSAQLMLLTQVDFVRKPEGAKDTGFVKETSGPNFRAGLEFWVNPEIALRSSYAALMSWDAALVGLGLAYKREKFALDYGMRVNPDSSESLIHALALSVDL
jgi:hypothetical protein